jgi:putative ABC transport system permease protein
VIGHILEQFLLHVPLLFGAVISFSLLKVPDLSIETAYVSGAFFGGQAALLCKDYAWPFQYAGIFASLFIGFFVGLVSSFLTKFLRISHLLSTIMTTGFFYTVNQLFFGSYLSLNQVRSLLYSSHFAWYPELFFLLLSGVLLFLFIWFLLRSNIGYLWVVYGINRDFLDEYRISQKLVFILGVGVANMLAGYAGYLQAQSNGFVEISMGFGKALVCLTSLIIGKILIMSVHPISLLRPIIGGIGYFILQASLIYFGWNTTYFSAMQAIVIALMLALNQHVTVSDDDLGV